MKRFAKRALALTLATLCLLMLPCPAPAEEPFCVGFDISFDVPQPFGDEVSEGAAELLRGLQLEGTWTAQGSLLDWDGSFTLAGRERTRTALHIFGREERPVVECSLLGQERVMITMASMTEFCLKMYNHLGLPLYRLAFCLPWCDAYGVEPLASLLGAALVPADGSGTISCEALQQLLTDWAELEWSGTGYSVWINALSVDTDVDSVLAGLLYDLSDWCAEHCADGLHVTRSGGVTRWTASDGTEAAVLEDGRLTVRLDGLASCGSLMLDWKGGSSLRLSAFLGSEEETLLRAEIAAENLPAHLSTTEPFTVSAVISGRCAEGLPVIADGPQGLVPAAAGEGGVFSVYCAGSREGLAFSRTAEDPVIAVMHTRWREAAPAALRTPTVAESGIDILCVNDSTLPPFIRSIFQPMVKGLLPLLVEVSPKLCAALMDTLSNTGVFAMGTMDEY